MMRTPCPRSEKPQRDRRSWSGWEEIPHIQGKKEKSQQDCRSGEFALRIKSHSAGDSWTPTGKSSPTRDTRRAQTNIVSTRTQGPPQRLRQNCV